MDARKRIELLVVALNRRNGGDLSGLDFSLRLLDARIGLDSLDLAEVLVDLEREYGQTPFDRPQPPRTWDELAQILEASTR
jgi:hypothetical protein